MMNTSIYLSRTHDLKLTLFVKVEFEKYEEIKRYLRHRTCSKRLETALNKSKVLKDALYMFKADITKNLDQYLLQKESNKKKQTF